jgi:triosephosphate isomerase
LTTASRRPYIAGNWKMHNTSSEAGKFIRELVPGVAQQGEVEVGLCVPFTALQHAVFAVSGTGIRILAQNMHQEPEGAYTGEVSAPMLLELGVTGVVLGHSERREHFCETDRALQEKVPAAIAAGLQPILCVGETEDERDSDETERRLRHQVQEALEKVPPERLPDVVIAYEPVWAIGTGRVATPDQAQSAMAFIRALVNDRSSEAAGRMRILYGGSVKPDNARELLGLPDVDGALVGGASLEIDSFTAIVEAALE